MSGLEQVYFNGHTLVRIDIYAKRNGFKLKTLQAMIARRELEEVAYLGSKYIKTNAVGVAPKSSVKKHEPISKVTTWRLNG